MFAPGTVQTTEGSLCPESGFTPKTMPLQKHHCETAFMFFVWKDWLAKKRFYPAQGNFCSALQSGENDNAKVLLGYRASPKR